MKKLSRRWAGWKMPQFLLIVLPALVLVFYLYVWRLGTLVPGFSAREKAQVTASSSLGAIKNNPLNAPHKLLQFTFQHFGHHGAFWMRSVSVFFALLFLLTLFLTLKKWFGIFIALLGTAMFAATPWVVITARSASADVMWLCTILVIFAYGVLARAKNRQLLAWFGLLLCLVLAAYTPGLAWVILVAFALSWRQILGILSKQSLPIALAGFVLAILLLAPLDYGFYLHPSLIKDWLLIPHHWQDAVNLVKSFGWSALSLFADARFHIDYVVGRLGILDIIQSVLAVIGVYALFARAKREALTLLAVIVIGLVAATLNNNAFLLTICLPAVALFDAAALRFLYLRWTRVFPQNPVPRALAVLLICLLVLVQLGYGVRYSLAAWPHNVDIRKAYVLK